MSEWIVKRGERTLGPFDDKALRRLAKEGRLKPTDLLSQGAGSKWVPAAKAKGLFETEKGAGAKVPSPVPQPLAPPEPGPPVVLAPPAARDPDPPSWPPAEVVYVERAPGAGTVGWQASRVVLAFACAAGMLGTFLPWVSLPLVGSISGTAGDGWITLVLFLVGLGLAVRGRPAEPLEPWARLVSILAVLAAGGIALDKILRLNDAFSASRMDDNPFARAMVQTSQTGPGLYLIVVAAGVALLAATVGGSSHRGSTGGGR